MSHRYSLQVEFPDYGDLDFTPPATWESCHWHNNTCPSWISRQRESDRTVLQLWADYADVQLRENPGYPRFFLYRCTDDGIELQTLLASDDYSAICAVIEREGN